MVPFCIPTGQGKAVKGLGFRVGISSGIIVYFAHPHSKKMVVRHLGLLTDFGE